MPGGVNAWRFRLAEEEEKRRRKFGWDDLFDLLSTAASGYSAVAGIGEARKRTALAQEQQDLATQGAGMDVLSEGREGVWNKLAETYRGPPTTAEIGEISGPLGRQQFREAPPQEWPEVPGQVHVGGGEYERAYPEKEPFIGPREAPPGVAGQKLTWQDPESGRPYYTREYPPDVTDGPEGMFEVPGTGQEIPRDSQQYRQFVLEMWREQNRGKNVWDAAAERFGTIYGNYPPKDLDARAEMGLIAAEISAMTTLETLAPEDVFVDILMAGSDVGALQGLGASWAEQNGEPAVTEAIATLIEILQKRATGR